MAEPDPLPSPDAQAPAPHVPAPHVPAPQAPGSDSAEATPRVAEAEAVPEAVVEATSGPVDELVGEASPEPAPNVSTETMPEISAQSPPPSQDPVQPNVQLNVQPTAHSPIPTAPQLPGGHGHLPDQINATHAGLTLDDLAEVATHLHAELVIQAAPTGTPVRNRSLNLFNGLARFVEVVVEDEPARRALTGDPLQVVAGAFVDGEATAGTIERIGAGICQLLLAALRARSDNNGVSPAQHPSPSNDISEEERTEVAYPISRPMSPSNSASPHESEASMPSTAAPEPNRPDAAMLEPEHESEPEPNQDEEADENESPSPTFSRKRSASTQSSVEEAAIKRRRSEMLRNIYPNGAAASVIQTMEASQAQLSQAPSSEAIEEHNHEELTDAVSVTLGRRSSSSTSRSDWWATVIQNRTLAPSGGQRDGDDAETSQQPPASEMGSRAVSTHGDVPQSPMPAAPGAPQPAPESPNDVEMSQQPPASEMGSRAASTHSDVPQSPMPDAPGEPQPAPESPNNHQDDPSNAGSFPNNASPLRHGPNGVSSIAWQQINYGATSPAYTLDSPTCPPIPNYNLWESSSPAPGPPLEGPGAPPYIPGSPINADLPQEGNANLPQGGNVASPAPYVPASPIQYSDE